MLVYAMMVQMEDWKKEIVHLWKKEIHEMLHLGSEMCDTA
jgi:hypothetical protein